MDIIQTFWTSIQSGQFAHLGWWSYALLALLVAIEGPVSTLLGAAAASAGFMHPPLMFLAAVAGNLSADLLWFSLGYAGKVDWLQRYGRWSGLKPQHLERLQRGIYDHSPRILLAAKLSAIFMIPCLLAAGLARVPWKRVLPTLLAGALAWTGALTLLGYFAGEATAQVERGLQVLGFAAAVPFLLGSLWVLRRVFRQKTLV